MSEEFKTPEGHITYYIQFGKDLEDGSAAFAQCNEDWQQIYTDIEWEDEPEKWVIHRKLNAPKVPVELIMEEIAGKTILRSYQRVAEPAPITPNPVYPWKPGEDQLLGQTKEWWQGLGVKTIGDHIIHGGGGTTTIHQGETVANTPKEIMTDYRTGPIMSVEKVRKTPEKPEPASTDAFNDALDRAMQKDPWSFR